MINTRQDVIRRKDEPAEKAALAIQNAHICNPKCAHHRRTHELVATSQDAIRRKDEAGQKAAARSIHLLTSQVLLLFVITLKPEVE